MSDVIEATPEVESPAVPEITPTEPAVEPAEEVVPPTETSSIDDLSEDELMAAIEAAIAASEKPTEPVSFPKVQPKEEVSAELDSEIKELLKLKESELEEAKRTLQEKQSQSEQIESAW